MNCHAQAWTLNDYSWRQQLFSGTLQPCQAQQSSFPILFHNKSHLPLPSAMSCVFVRIVNCLADKQKRNWWGPAGSKHELQSLVLYSDRLNADTLFLNSIMSSRLIELWPWVEFTQQCIASNVKAPSWQRLWTCEYSQALLATFPEDGCIRFSPVELTTLELAREILETRGGMQWEGVGPLSGTICLPDTTLGAAPVFLRYTLVKGYPEAPPRLTIECKATRYCSSNLHRLRCHNPLLLVPTVNSRLLLHLRPFIGNKLHELIIANLQCEHILLL